MECSICHGPIEDQYGRNPQPVANLAVEDRCCGWCDDHIVIPVRLRMMGVPHSEHVGQVLGQVTERS